MTGPMSTAPTVAATPSQEALWWVHQRAKNRSVYNLTWRLGCDRPPDPDALAVAWQAVTDRHDALRASVAPRAHSDAGTVELTVVPALAVDVRRVDIDDPGDTPAAELFRLIAEEVNEQPMRLDVAPLALLTLVRIGDEYELLLTGHHIVIDGWANQLLLADLSIAYAAASQGRQPEFDTAAPSLPAYAEDCAAAGADGRWQAGLDYWCATLEGAASTTVVRDHDRAAGVGGPGTTVRYAFSDEASAGVRALARATMATPFGATLAATEIVLAAGGAGADVAVGVTVANRMSQQEQELVGYTANLCVARAQVSTSDTILDVVGRARDGMWTMLTHQSVPYPVVFGALTEPTRATLGDTVPVVLDYLGPIGGGLSLGDVALEWRRSPNRAARADILVVTWDTGDGGLMAEVEYDTARYDRSTVMGLLEDIDTVLAAAPGTTVGELSLVTRSVPAYADRQRPVGASPATPVGDAVARMWAQVLGEPPDGQDEDFFARGGRSLKVLQLASVVRADIGAELDLTRWLAEPTPRRLAEQLSRARQDTESTLVTLRDGDGPHLHLLPGAGGDPDDYRPLVDALPAHWRVTASRERQPLATVPELAAVYRADLALAGLRPDVLAGWSTGGLLAFEMAAGDPVPLAVLDSTPPVGYPWDAEAEATRFAVFVDMIRADLDVRPVSPVVRGGDDLRIGVLAASLAAAGQSVPASVLDTRWQAYRRHARAVAAYLPSAPVTVPALVVAADLLESQVDQWAALLGPVRRLRLATGHRDVLRGGDSIVVATAIESLVTANAAR